MNRKEYRFYIFTFVFLHVINNSYMMFFFEILNNIMHLCIFNILFMHILPILARLDSVYNFQDLLIINNNIGKLCTHVIEKNFKKLKI